MVRGQKQRGSIVRRHKIRPGNISSSNSIKLATEKGAGFIAYEYPKPGAPRDQSSPKLSYVKFFAPWQWTIVTGVYTDDINGMVWSRVLWTVAPRWRS